MIAGTHSVRASLMALLFAGLPLTAQPVITTTGASIPAGTVGATYAGVTFAATGCGMSGCTWSITSNMTALYGLTMSSGGALSGTVEACANFWAGNAPCDLSYCNYTFNPMVCPFTVQASSTSTGTTAQQFSISVSWTPAYATYLSDQYSYFHQMAQAAGPSPPPILAGGHLVIANPFFRDSRYDNQSAWNAWVDAMNDAGMKIVNIEVDLECLISNRPSCLSLYAGAIKHAHDLGMSVSINPAYYTTASGNTAMSCGDAGCPGNGAAGGIGGACAAALGSPINSGTIAGTNYGSGVFDWHHCLVTYVVPSLGTLTGMPAYQYVLTYWLSPGDRFVPVHEPTTQASQWNEFTNSNSTSATDCSQSASGSTNGQYCSGAPGPTISKSHRTCPQDWLDNFLTPFFNTDLPGWSGVPSGIIYGATVNPKEMATGSGMTGGYYATAFTNGLSANIAMGMDMYDFEPSSQTEYTKTISMFQGNSASGYQHGVFVEEFGPNAWTYYNGPTGEGCAIVGLQSCTWSTFNQDFFASLLPFLSSQGVTDSSLYGASVLGACAPVYPDNPQDDNDVLNTATIAMENHQYSITGVKLSAILSQWNAAGIQGACKLTGGKLLP